MKFRKDKQKIELRPVDEKSDTKARIIRLGKDAVEEEVEEELPTVRVGDGASSDFSAQPASKDELKIRTNDPGIESLIEKEVVVSGEAWDSEFIEDRNFPFGWVVLVACIFSAAILWSLFNLNEGSEKSALLTEEAKATQKKEEQEEINVEAQVTVIEKTTRNFFDSRSVEEMLRYVRYPQRVRPLMEKYYATEPLKPIRIENMLSLSPLTIDNYASYWWASCQLEGDSKAHVILESISNKEAKVDWETYVCYQPMAWDKFANERPSGYTGDFRVYVEKDTFYSHEFSDSNAFDSYRLTALDGEEVLFGYVPCGRELGLRMQELTGNKEGVPQALILRLYIPKELESKRGVVIQKIVSPRWFVVDDSTEAEP
jgi:hypothetical protein